MSNSRRRACWRLWDSGELDRRGAREILRGRGWPVKHGSTKADLVKSIERLWVRLPCYEKCKYPELLGFAKARGLIPPLSPRKKRDELIRLLIEADKQPSFDRFLDLPAELRNRIYEFHIASFNHRADPLVGPAIAQTCTQIKNEMLPVFYNDCEFKLTYELPDDAGWPSPVQADQLRLKPTTPTSHFFAMLTPTIASQLRSLEVTIEGVAGSGLFGAYTRCIAVAFVVVGQGKGLQEPSIRVHYIYDDAFLQEEEASKAAVARVVKDTIMEATQNLVLTAKSRPAVAGPPPHGQ